MTKVNTPLIHQLRQRESLEGRREARPPDWEEEEEREELWFCYQNFCPRSDI